jgi:hypothetical protein
VPFARPLVFFGAGVFFDRQLALEMESLNAQQAPRPAGGATHRRARTCHNAPSDDAPWQFGEDTLLVLQRKRRHGRRARPIVSCTCDGERTNRDNKSSDNGEYDLKHRSPPFRGSLWCKRYALPSL